MFEDTLKSMVMITVSYLIRMVKSTAVWNEDVAKKEDDLLPADIFAELNTQENKISTWDVNSNNEDGIKKAVVALASAFASLDSIKYVVLDADRLAQRGFTLEASAGKTNIEKYRDLHYDITNLTSSKLRKFAREMLNCVLEYEVKTVQKDEIIKWLVEEMNNDSLQFDDLNKNLRVGLASKIEKLQKKNIMNVKDNVMMAVENQVMLNRKKTNCIYEGQCEKYSSKKSKSC